MNRSQRAKRNHAQARLVERGGGDLSFQELEERVKKRDIEYLIKLTVTQSLIRVEGPVGYCYAIINRKSRRVKTVLTKEQAILRAQANGRQLRKEGRDKNDH